MLTKIWTGYDLEECSVNREFCTSVILRVPGDTLIGRHEALKEMHGEHMPRFWLHGGAVLSSVPSGAEQ